MKQAKRSEKENINTNTLGSTMFKNEGKGFDNRGKIVMGSNSRYSDQASLPNNNNGTFLISYF